jgi:hypothetical protein
LSKNTSNIPTRKLKGKRLLGRTRCRWQDNIEMNLNEIGYGGMEWIYLIRYRGNWWTLTDMAEKVCDP